MMTGWIIVLQMAIINPNPYTAEPGLASLGLTQAPLQLPLVSGKVAHLATTCYKLAPVYGASLTSDGAVFLPPPYAWIVCPIYVMGTPDTTQPPFLPVYLDWACCCCAQGSPIGGFDVPPSNDMPLCPFREWQCAPSLLYRENFCMKLYDPDKVICPIQVWTPVSVCVCVHVCVRASVFVCVLACFSVLSKPSKVDFLLYVCACAQ